MDNILPITFKDPDFAELNHEAFDAYIEYRVKGHHASVAYRRVFDEHSQAHLITEYIEHNPYYKAKFAQRLKDLKASDLWDEKIAVHELLSTARNPFFKDSTRLQAMKELNILTNITIVDENGKTKAGRKLMDFYAEEGNALTQ